MANRSDQQAAVVALEREHPQFMVWVDPSPDGDTWLAFAWDNTADVFVADDAATLGQALAQAEASGRGLIEATDAGGWVSGPQLPAPGRPLLTEAVRASMARNGGGLHRPFRSALLRLLSGEAVR